MRWCGRAVRRGWCTARASTRKPRRIVKGRFQAGGVGYVHTRDLALYANAFRRPVSEMSATQEQVYEALCLGGPLTSSLLKEETGLPKKQINPALQRLQEAFLVYEDQVDDDWERGWHAFSSEWPAIDLNDATRERAASAATALRDEVLALVRAAYPEPRHRVLRYAGTRI